MLCKRRAHTGSMEQAPALCAGVRSLGFMDHLLSCGSGHGRLFFYDLRAGAYLDMAASARGVPSAPSGVRSGA